MSVHTLDPLYFPLHGSRLIEASAGTGKTWTIAALYLRLVLGHGGEHGFSKPLLPQEILVMTFTRAATRELQERIRDRLVQAVACFRGEARPDPADGFLSDLLAAYPDPVQRQSAAWRLALAAQNMDEAAIHTIDAWCQRMLREHAFDSGNLFEETLESDDSHLRAQAVQDYWRQQVYPLTDVQLPPLLQAWASLDALQADMQALRAASFDPSLGAGSLAQVLAREQAARTQRLTELAQGWADQAQRYQDWLDGQLEHNASAWNRRKLVPKNYGAWLEKLSQWAANPDADLKDALRTGATRLVPAGLDDARANQVPLDYPPQAQALADLLDALDHLPQPSIALRQHAAIHIQQRLQWLKQQAGTFGFDDMLQRLNAALLGPQGESLRARIRAQYPAALIDEFQDTSPQQYQLFDHIYDTAANRSDLALLLIGDPKQSIYSFRGADIYSYLQARRATAGRHYVLGTNYRSTAAMVEAVNQWFEQAEARPGAGAFRFRDAQAPEDNPLPFTQVGAQGRSEVFVHHGQVQPAMTLVWHSPDNLDSAEGANAPDAPITAQTHTHSSLLAHLAQCCAEQISQWLGNPETGFQHPETGLQRLQPSDIAILVRDKNEAHTVRQALRLRGVASVYVSDKESIFSSDEAQDVLLWLRAVAAPLDARALRAAQATGLASRSLAELEQLAHDDNALDAESDTLRQLHHIWQRQGVLAMLRHSLHRQDWPRRWQADPSVFGERRLTNLLHLAELLQTASATLEGEHALIRWLAEQIDQPQGESDEQVLRLESDADLVQVVTIHKSKGLEYPLVCLPLALHYKPKERANTSAVRLPLPAGGQQLHLDYDDAQLQQAEEERLREDLRLLYVALTRARHALWLGWGALRRGRDAACVNHRTAGGYLLGGQEGDTATQWQQRLHHLVQQHPEMAWQLAPQPVPQTPLPPRAPANPLRPEALHPDSQHTTLAQQLAGMERNWGLASFSALVRDMGRSMDDRLPPDALNGAADTADHTDTNPQPEPNLPQRPADDEPHSDATQVQPAWGQAPVPGASAAPWHHHPGGALVGNFLHDQLQWLSEEDFALPPLADINAALAQHSAPDALPEPLPPLASAVLRRCQRAGRSQHAPDTLRWLCATVHHPLPPLGCSLAELAQRHPDAAAHSPPAQLAELEFWMPLTQLPSTQVDALCRQHLLPGQARPTLPERNLRGMLMGFADLVLYQGGRYWVLDYKTNHLGPNADSYTAPALAQAMLAHRYDVQAALYQLALHRLLRQRLGQAYQPEHHLGGALYYFIRGLDGPAQGLHVQAPPLALLQALEMLLDGQPASSAQPDKLEVV